MATGKASPRNTEIGNGSSACYKVVSGTPRERWRDKTHAQPIRATQHEGTDRSERKLGDPEAGEALHRRAQGSLAGAGRRFSESGTGKGDRTQRAPMNAILESMDLEYELHFRTPLFELPARSVEVLQALHAAFSPVTEPSSSDMQVLGGSRLSEVRIGMNLFGGEGWLNLTADQLTMRFSRLQRPDHLGECKACIAAAERTLAAALPGAAVRTAMIKATLSLRLDGTAPSAGHHLAKVAGDRPQVDLSGLGNATIQRAVALDIQNEEECWEAVFDAYRSRSTKWR